MASAAEEQHETSRTTETLKHHCESNKRLLLEANQKLLHRTSDLKELQTLYDASKAEVERLSAELSNMEAWKVVTAAELDVKVTDMNKKYTALKRVCRGKDMMINQLREEKSKALMQLWQTAYGHKAKYFSCTPTHADRQIPMATVEPYQNEVITFCNATSPVKCQDIGDQLNDADFIKNKTMSMELELYRKRKMAEIFRDKFNPLQPDWTSVETRSTGSGSGCDVSASISEFRDVVLDDIPEETLNHIGDQLNDADFIKNKTMSMELELYRTRKMAEIFRDKFNPLQPDWASVDTRSTGSGSGCDVSASISEFRDVVLDDIPEETLNHIGDQLNDADFIKNKTMSMELELYRTRKMAEIFGDKFNPLQPDWASVDTRSTGSGSGCDVSTSISEFRDVVLDDIREETLNQTYPQSFF